MILLKKKHLSCVTVFADFRPVGGGPLAKLAIGKDIKTYLYLFVSANNFVLNVLGILF